MAIRKLLSLLMAGCLSLASLAPASALAGDVAQEPPVFTDMEQSWAKEQLAEWADSGFVKGYADGSVRPDETISRAEFVALVNRVYGYAHASDSAFLDVEADAWFADDVAKAARAGYASGYEDGTFRPDREISRQEAAKMVAALLKLEAAAEGGGTASAFTDRGDIPAWSIGYVDAIAAEGYLQGYPDGAFRPASPITRAEAVALLDRAAGKILHKPAAFGKDEEQTVVAGNVTVRSPDVTLKNTVIQGDLYLAPGIGEGEVYLDRVTVEGRTIVAGGGENSIVISDSSLNDVIVEKVTGEVRLVAQGGTVIHRTVVKTGVKLEENNATQGFLEVEVMTTEASASVRLVGDFRMVTVVSAAKIDIAEGSVVEEIVVHAAIAVTGEGKILFAAVHIEGVSFEQTVVRYELSEGVTEIIIGGEGASGGVGTEPDDPVSAPEGSSPTAPTVPTVPNVPTVPTVPTVPSEPGSGEPEAPAPTAQAVFVTGDKLVAAYDIPGDATQHRWTLKNSVSDSVYEAVYTAAGATYGIFAVQASVPLDGGVYTATREGSSEAHPSVFLSSITVSGSVYAAVYYGGTEAVGYAINDGYVATLDRHPADGAVPLRDGDAMKLFYGDTIVFEAVWDQATGLWKFERFSERIRLNAPENVAAFAISNTELGLLWDAVEHAEYYYVYYSDSQDGEYRPFLDETGNKTRIERMDEPLVVDPTNAPHSTRYYKVTAGAAMTESAFSAAAWATTYYNKHIPLDFTPTDLIEHPTEPILFMTDKAGQALHAVNYDTEEIVTVALPLPPESIAYADGELYVGLLKGEHSSYREDQSGAIAVLDASTLETKALADVAIDPYDIAVDRSGTFYVSSGSSQWTDIKSYARATMTEIATTGIRQQSFIHMHPTLNKLYAVTTDTSPRDLTAFPVANGAFADADGYDSPYHGNYAMSTNFELSPDGRYAFNGAGTVFRTTDSKYDDMRYVYALNRGFADIAFQLADGSFYTAKDKLIGVYDYGSFEQTGQYHTDGTTARLANGTDKLAVVSALNGKSIIEIVEKDAVETLPPVASQGVAFDGIIADIAVDVASNLLYAVDKAFWNLYTVDLESRAIVHTLKLPYRPSGIDLSEDRTKLYIVNDAERQLVTEVSLPDYSIVRHLNAVSAAGDEENAHRHVYDYAGKLFVVTGQWDPTLLLFDAATFAPVAYAPSMKSVGGIAFASGESKFYYWHQYGWGAGYAGSDVYEVSVNGTSLAKTDASSLGYPNMDRDPLDAPVLLAKDESLVIAKDKVFSSADLSQVIHEFPEPIYAVSPNGDRAAGKTGIYDLTTFEKLETLSLAKATHLFYDAHGNLHYMLDNALRMK
ncbi:S-layer homology domain-containing protein [Paenibacillus antri]|uniref:S-layer homology domain-containing protein n=1 Tax=Paenibacillus antri TaxID=2582848 RepID=UPI0013054815|nr:S-layer homology domain-containing protein [Paenibacillus antri]